MGTGAFLDVAVAPSGMASALTGDGVARVFCPERIGEDGVRHVLTSAQPGRAHGIAPDGKALFVGDRKSVAAYATDDGRELWRIETLCNAAVHVGPGGERAYFLSGRQGVEMVEVASGRSRRINTTPQSPRMAVSPKGRWVMVAGKEPVALLHDARTLDLARNVELPSSPVLALAFLRTRTLAVSVAADRLQAVELPSGETLWAYMPDVGHVTHVARVDDNRAVVSCHNFHDASSEFTVLETETGRRLLVAVGWSQAVTGTACYPLPGGDSALTNHGFWISLRSEEVLGRFVFLPDEQWALWRDGELVVSSDGIDRYIH